jgi:hypothetical protein
MLLVERVDPLDGAVDRELLRVRQPDDEIVDGLPAVRVASERGTA